LIGVVGALAIGFGLAFGLGGRERAAQLIDTMGRNVQQAGPKLERAASVAQHHADEMARQTQGTTGSSRAAMGNGWVERSLTDRRRVERPGIQDRRGDRGTS
jgi:hypothetical protein